MCVLSVCVCVCHAHGYCAANCQPPPRSKVATSTRKRSLPVLTWSPERGSLAFQCLGHCFSHRKALFFSFRRVGCMCGWVVFLGTPPKTKMAGFLLAPFNTRKDDNGGKFGAPPKWTTTKEGGAYQLKKTTVPKSGAFLLGESQDFPWPALWSAPFQKKSAQESVLVFVCFSAAAACFGSLVFKFCLGLQWFCGVRAR